ncbi:hypothetical protein J4Q44_G00265900 [Coregonus suidteri]|uniref:Zinc finger FYVE domain-containing protein n=1 Tax=Coregonus suidteri TaxID=861788 RepID=A0AAN8L5U1_9TELE
MENYFQAEAFNLDKVFDDFQQNQDDETDSLSDVKWIQILAPPAHLLSLNPALSLTPDLDPLPVKTLPPPDPSSSDPQGPDAKRHPTAEPPPWGEERPDCRADVQSPPLPQPNIGKLLGGEEGSSPPMSASSSPPPYHHHHHHHSALENGCSSTSPSSPASPALSGLSEEPCKGNQTRVTVTPSDHHQPPTPSDPCPDAPVGERGGERSGGSSHVSHTHFTFEERLGGDETIAEKLNSKPETERAGAGSPIQDSGREEAGMAGGQSQDNGEEGRGNTGGTMEGPREQKECRNSSQKQKRLKGEKEKESRGGQDGEKTLTNGLATAGEEEEEEEGQSLLPPPSKEDSVTEEKEMEESKQENGGEGGSSVGSKLSNSHLQPLSGMFGGARPKQPVNLKLQIPWPLSGHVQNQLAPTANTTTAVCKNKNLENRAGGVTTDTATVVAGGDPGGCVVVVNGELLSGSPSSLLGLVVASESSPDNDLQAGYHHQGALPRKLLSSLGDVAPVWVPDSQAPVCMKCEARFTFTKRRHHCRACGKVFCAACCNRRSRLLYMDRKEARVCNTCHAALLSAHSREGTCGGSNQSPNPNNPAEFCSTVPPLQQVQASGALASLPPPVMVPVGVPKTPGSEGCAGFLSRERKRVWFADGILANGEAAESPKPSASSPAPSQPLAVSQCSNKSFSTDLREASSPAPATTVGSPVGSSVSLIPEDGLPPILTSTGVKGDVNRKCWYVTSKGMHAVGQAEVVVLLQCLPDEKKKDIFSHFVPLPGALKGNVLTHLGHSFFTQSFLGSREHGGFLYVSPSFQALQDLMLPNPPYLFGVLLQKWETPWAKAFPIRLMLRLGAEYRFYPCPLFSVRFRKPLFGETGHTIMTLLVDFRNYQYTLPVVKGLVVDMEARKTCVKIPGNRYNELMKAMNKSNEHVLAMGACFNEQADSHLVGVQNDDGNYQTQAISIHHQPDPGHQHPPPTRPRPSASTTNQTQAISIHHQPRRGHQHPPPTRPRPSASTTNHAEAISIHHQPDPGHQHPPPTTQRPSASTTNHTQAISIHHQPHPGHQHPPPTTHRPSASTTNHTEAISIHHQPHTGHQHPPPTTQRPSASTTNHAEAISIHHQPRRVTGACFFVSSGSLKAASGHLAKTSIVEDGVMVQITAETMDALRQALRDMKDFSITCGRADQQDTQEHVHIQWTDDDHSFFNKGVISPIDGKSMEFNTSVKIFHGSEFKANGKVIRWTEVFFVQSDDQPNGLSDPADHSRLTENVARAFCVALCPHLKLLKDDGMAKLGLRVTLESDQVGYLAGSNGQPLPSHYLSDLDRTLIPVIHRGAGQLSEGPVVMELVFYILEILS